MSPRRLFDLPYLLLLLAVSFWSLNFILGRAVRMEIPPIALAFWRWAGASVLILPFAMPHLRREWSTVRSNWPILLVLAATGVAVFNTLVYSGLQSTVAINAFLIQSTMPVVIVALSFLVFDERLHARQGVGVALSLLGALTIIVQGDPALLLQLSLNRGDLLIFVAVVSYAAYSVLLRRRPPLHPLTFIAVTFVAGALMLLPFYLWESITRQAMSLNPVSVFAVLYVAVFPSIISYLCFNRGVELVGANRAGLFIHLMPVMGSVLAVLLLGERFQWYHALGIVFIAAGIALAIRPRS